MPPARERVHRMAKGGEYKKPAVFFCRVLSPDPISVREHARPQLNPLAISYGLHKHNGCKTALVDGFGAIRPNQKLVLDQ